MTINRNPKAAIGAVLTATALLTAACNSGTGGSGSGGDEAGGVKTGPGIDAKSKTISVGVISALSGPVSVIGKPISGGLTTHLKAINDAGGINGWKIKINTQDAKYDPALSAQAFAALQPGSAMIAQSLGSPTTHAFDAKAAATGIVVGTAAQDSAFVTRRTNAVIGTPYAAEAANSLYYVSQKAPKAKVALFYQNDAYGQDGKRGYEAAVRAYGLRNVKEVTYSAQAAAPDFTSQVQQLKGSGAKYVFVVATPSPASTLVGTAASTGYKPQWVLQSPGWSGLLMTSTGTAKGAPTKVAPALEGAWVGGYGAQWGDRSVPGMNTFLAEVAKYAPAQAPDSYFMYGYCQAEMVAAVLNKAIASKDLSRQGILNAKLNLGQISFRGLMPDATYTPALGPASRKSTLYQVKSSAAASGFLQQLKPFYASTAAANLAFTGK